MTKTETMRRLAADERDQKKNLEARIELMLLEMSERDFSRAQSFKETMMLLKHLRETVQKTGREVENSVSILRAFPDSAAERVANRIEKSAIGCENAASKAKGYFHEALKEHLKERRFYWLGLLLASFLGASLVVAFLYVMMPDYEIIEKNQQTIYNAIMRK